MRVVLTGTFHSSNWIDAHLRPLAAAAPIECVYLVTTLAQPSTDRVRVVLPPSWLRRVIGDVPARLLAFGWTCLTARPHFVGGFHLLMNGLAAGLIAPFVRARSLYFNVGGAWEVLDGGLRAENRLFSRVGAADPRLERDLIACVRSMDVVVTMGSRAAAFWRENGVASVCHVIGGGIDATRYGPSQSPATTDVVFVGRLAPIKRVDVLLDAVALLRRRTPRATLTIVGDGELRATLESQAQRLGLQVAVTFAGRKEDVRPFLHAARAFVLTSDSEGVPLSALEAMLCGLPAVTTDVGDLRDLITHGESGFLARASDPADIADKLYALLRDEAERVRMAEAARRAALRYDLKATAARWEAVLRGRNCGCSACQHQAANEKMGKTA